MRGAIFSCRPSFIKKMQKILLNCSPWPNKSERVAELWGAESLGLWLLKFWILWKSKDGFLRNFKFCKVDFFSNMKQVFGKFFSQPLDIGFRCFVPKNHENWLYRLGAMAKKPSKTWFFMFFDFLAFLTHPNDQKRFWRARYYFFHVWTPLKKFRQNLGTPSTKVFIPVWIQSEVKVIKCCPSINPL